MMAADAIALDLPRTGHRSLTGTSKLLIALIFAMLVSSWAPKFTSVSDVNLNFVVALCMLAVVALLRGGMSPVLATKFDAKAALLMLSAAAMLSALAVLSMFYAEEPLRVFRVAYGQVLGVAIMLCVLAVPSDRLVVNKLVDALICCAVVSSYVALLAYLVPSLRSSLFFGLDRASGLFKNANQFGLALSLVIPLGIARISVSKRRIVLCIALASMFMGLILSGSKTNLLISCVSSAVMIGVIMNRYRLLARRPALAFAILVLAGVAAIAAYFALEKLNPRALQLLHGLREDGTVASLDQRSAVWEWSLSTALDHPLLGVGAGQSVYGGLTHSHNVFLDFFRMLGLPGLAIVAVQVFACSAVAAHTLMLRGLHPTREADSIIASALAISTLAYIAGNQTSDSFGPSTLPIFWLVTAILLLHRRDVLFRS